MTFTTLNLSGERVLVKGTDSHGGYGETVVSSSQWLEIKARTQVSQAHQDFDAVVEEFFKPITDAAEKLCLEHDKVQQDPSSFVVIDEGEEATAGRRRNVVTLSKDSIVLRLLEEGGSDRLVWVNETLEVLEILPGTTPTQGYDDLTVGVDPEATPVEG